AFFAWPRHKVEELGTDWHVDGPVVSSGPFVLEAESDERIRYTENRFWPSASSNVAELVIHTLDPYESRELWREGRLDLVFIPELTPEPGPETVIVPITTLGTGYLAFPPHAPFDDVRLRQALAHGLDRTSLDDGTGRTAAGGGLLPPSMPGHSHDIAPVHD